MRFDAHFGIERAHARRRERGFLAAAVGERVPGLAMQVGRFEPVAVDDAEAADAGAGEVLQHRHAEAAGADHQHGCGAQSRLACGADFAQRDLARVVRRGRACVRVVVLVRMFMRVVRRARAALAVHPAGIAVDVVFLLPDRDAMLDFVDDEAAGAERLVAMRGADAHPDGDVADRRASRRDARRRRA